MDYRVTDRYLTVEEKQRLCRVMLKINSLNDPDLRNMYVAALEDALGQPLNVTRHSEAQFDLFEVITACQSYPGALHTLVSIIVGFHAGSTAATEVQDLLAELERELPLRPVDRAALVQLLRAVPAARIAAGFNAAVQPGQRETSPNWHDLPSLVRRLETAFPDGRQPPVIMFAEWLAHHVDPRAGQQASRSLHQWVDTAGGSLGLDQDAIRAACLETRRRSSTEGSATYADASDHDLISQSSAKGLKTDPTIAGDPVPSSSLPRAQTHAPPGYEAPSRPIRGNIPIRNPDFTGRESLLEQLRTALETSSKASVLPRALHGLGGVGKTQLAVEYVYRFTDDYDLIWWISAEQATLTLTSLSELCGELGLPLSQDQKQTAEAVLRALNTSPLRWLLVFDNADDPEDIVSYVPSAGGHVIITSRNQAWTNVWEAVEVNVFDRQESVELLRKRSRPGLSPQDADRLAEKLGDLPLALDQAATWQAATSMPVSEYLDLFDEHVRELMDEGKPPSYRTTVAAFVSLASEQLRATKPVVAQLLELFAFLGPEPVSVSLLRRARQADISEPLRQALGNPIVLDRAIRDLGRYGLAKVDPNRRVQVHRLVQMVLREGMTDEQARQSRANAQNLFASANPAYPDEARYRPVYAEIGPHILPAGLIDADSFLGRQVVVDQIRYLYVIGDYEGSQRLAEAALETWSRAEEPGLGPDVEQTLITTRHLANAVRDLGDRERARQLDTETLERLRRNPDFGPEHEHTLATITNVGADLRIAGEYREALRVDRENVALHERVFGDTDIATIRARNGLGVDLRLTSDYQGAMEIDDELVRTCRDALGETDNWYLLALSNLALDLYGRGRYSEALEAARRAYPGFRANLEPGHHWTLATARTIGVALRKTGEYKEALAVSRDTYRDHETRLGPDHERTLLATMSYANALRAASELAEARSVAVEAVQRYRQSFGEAHPFTLAASANLAIIHRAVGEKQQARRLDEATLDAITTSLGPEHGYTLCVASNFAIDLGLSRELRKARELSEHTLAVSRRVRGESHPYTLACAVNTALDMQATGDEAAGQTLLDETVTKLSEVLGLEHPETIDASRFKRAECDIEPPPT